jgi:hypothetical protein
LGWIHTNNHLGYCFNTDCVDFCVPLGILLLEVKQLMWLSDPYLIWCKPCQPLFIWYQLFSF